MKKDFLEYGFRLCDNVIEKFPDGVISPNAKLFTYHHGVLLSGMEKMSVLGNREKYEEYIRLWVDNMLSEDGIKSDMGKGWCSLESLDFRQPAILLFNLYKKTADEKFGGKSWELPVLD